MQMAPILFFLSLVMFCVAQDETTASSEDGPPLVEMMPKHYYQVGNDCGISSVPNHFVVNGSISDSTMQRIVGGSDAKKDAYPWQVIVLAGGFCGGSLISKDWVITAAHCLGAPASNIRVRLGVWNHELRTEFEKECKVKSVATKSYNNKTIINDIALLKIDCGANFEFTDSYRPICLPEASDDIKNSIGTQVIITGWGTTSFEGRMSTRLNEAVIAVSKHCSCVKTYAGSAIRNGWLCAAAQGRDTCQGDSGGPLIHYSNGKFYLHGVTSFGAACASGHPGVYTDVPVYRSWIRSLTGI